MINRRTVLLASFTAIVALSVVAVAQRMRGRRDIENADRGGVPEWKNDERFKHDVFTFVRIRYGDGYSRRGRYGYGWGGGKWSTDYPDSDFNFSFRLQQLTALEVNSDPIILELTDPRLFDYPWIYLIEPGNMYLEDEEVAALRKYLLNGGFLMVDDFWGESEWAVFYENIKRVFPEKEPIELPLEHEIFQCVFKLSKKPQIPSIHGWYEGRTAERWDAQEPHYRGIFDDKGRMMAIICHNTDVGDGWEREGVDPGYFKEFSEKWSYPLGINIVTYAMTH
jgi:hypothetical protein